MAWTAFIFSRVYLILGLGWVFGAHPPGPADLFIVWFWAVAIAGCFIPGIANQVSLARAYLAAPALGGLALISMHRRPELRHTVSGQISTALIIVLVGGICLFRFLGQDASNVVVGAEIAIPVATIATFVHLGWV